MSPARLMIKSLASPTSEIPERSPLISAANTGTPARANPSAITCSETVFPVPVAPVTRPWRFARPSVSQTGWSPFPMKIFSSVSAILLSDVAIAPPLRAHRPGAMIISHLASRLNPVNGIWGSETRLNETRSTGFVLSSAPKDGTDLRSRDNLLRISQLLLHCCNTHHAIEGESRFRMRSSLVIRIAEDQDKFTGKDPARSRLRAG